MDKLWIAGWALGAALATATTAAPAQQPGDTVTIPGAAHRIELPAQRYHMDRSEFDEFKGDYQLSNGQTMYLTQRGYIMYAEIGDQGPHRIVATSRNSFVALDRKLKMTIDWRSDGTVGGEVTMVVPTRDVATGEIKESTVVVAMR